MIDENTLSFSNAFVWRDVATSIHPRLPQRTNVQVSSRHRFDMRKNRSLANSMRLMFERDRFQAAIELEDYSKVKTMSLVVPWLYVDPNTSYTVRLLDMTRVEWGWRMSRAFGISGLTLYAKLRDPTPSEPLESWMLGSEYKANIGTFSLGVSHDPNHPNDPYMYGIRFHCPL